MYKSQRKRDHGAVTPKSLESESNQIMASVYTDRELDVKFYTTLAGVGFWAFVILEGLRFALAMGGAH